MKTGVGPDGDIASGREREPQDLIACQPELLTSLAQIQPAYKGKTRAGHYLKRALLSSAVVKKRSDVNGGSLNGSGGDLIVSVRSEEDLRCSQEPVSREPWFRTWPNREHPVSPEFQEEKTNSPVPLEQVDLPIVYDPQTKGLHLATSSSARRGHSRCPEGSYSSTVSSLSDASPLTKEDDEDYGCCSLPNTFEDDDDSVPPVGDLESTAESDSGRSHSDDAELRRIGVYGLLSKWKVKSDEYWNLFSRSDSASSSPSRQRSDTETSSTNDRVLGSTALIQLDRPRGLPAKATSEARAHSEEHDKIISSVRKREQKEAKLRKKQLQCQLKVENDLVRSTRIWNQEILPKWPQTKNQKRTLELWWQGLPPCIRGKLWQLAIPNDLNITKELFEICLSRARERLLRSSAAGSTDSLDDFNDSLVDRAASVELIQLDISRTFPHLCIFQKKGPYYDVLHGLLAAYVCYRPDIGYVQGMSFIAAVLILNMDASEAFICFANLLNRPCHRAFYSLDQPVVGGVKFWAYHAGHVLGAAMFMLEISGVKILYTGDFSRQEDRHLMAAEIPSVRPDVLITEATYGTHVHENREEREGRFTALVHEIVTRGGRCLIPVFALGRAQELLLILDEYWSQHPELHDIPIYYASSLAKKCMAVYQTYVNAMNDKIKRQIAVNNPFVFTHISNLKGIDQFEDIGPCVVMASPGMMQSGLSRELFESWCTDSKNGVIIAGYCVEGTPAKTILSEPEEIVTMSGQKLKLNMTVAYISFSAHTDYQQTSDFIRQLEPPHIVLVHGEQNEMSRLKSALQREYEGDPERSIKIYNPRNTESVELYFRGEKIAKVMGSLAVDSPKPGNKISGILVKRDFNYHILAPSDLGKYTSLTTSQVSQKQLIPFGGSLAILRTMLAHVASPLETVDMKRVRAFNCIDITLNKKNVVLEWLSTPVNDMFADCIFSTILEAESIDNSASLSNVRMKMDRMHFKECVIEMLQEMFGEECVPKIFKGDRLQVTVNGRKANIDLLTLDVVCKEDSSLQQVVLTAITKLYQSLTPASAPLVKDR